MFVAEVELRQRAEVAERLGQPAQLRAKQPQVLELRELADPRGQLLDRVERQIELAHRGHPVQAVGNLKPGLRAIQDLTDYATSYRYPSPKGRSKAPPDKATFDREADTVQAALADAVARFGVDLDKAEAPARSAGPIR